VPLSIPGKPEWKGHLKDTSLTEPNPKPNTSALNAAQAISSTRKAALSVKIAAVQSVARKNASIVSIALNASNFILQVLRHLSTFKAFETFFILLLIPSQL
jgi:hypothetical protein